MPVRTVSEVEEATRLRSAYDHAWQQLSLAVTMWQATEDSAVKNDARRAEAELALHSAHSQYNEARNALAEFLLENANARGAHLARTA